MNSVRAKVPICREIGKVEASTRMDHYGLSQIECRTPQRDSRSTRIFVVGTYSTILLVSARHRLASILDRVAKFSC
jgi:hypothetical protein